MAAMYNPCDRLFRCHTDVPDPANPSGPPLLAAGEGGVTHAITNLPGGVDGMIVRTYTRLTGNAQVTVPRANIDIGAVEGSTIPINFVGFDPVASNLNPPGPTVFGDATDIRRHIAGFLIGVYDNRARIPQLEPRHTYWLDGQGAIQTTSEHLYRDIKRCSPKLPDVLSKKDFTINDVTGALKPHLTGNHTCATYMRKYSNFKQGTPFHGRPPCIYIGTTSNMDERQSSHRSSTWNEKDKSYNAYHYQVARAAGSTEVYQIAQHEPLAGGSERRAQGLVSISEQTFIAIFGSCSEGAKRWREKAGTKNMAQAISEQVDIRELALLYDEIAQSAFTKTGFAYPDAPNRAKSFGASGLNFSSPLGGEPSHYEQTTWTMQELPDRWIFTRSAQIFKVQLFRVEKAKPMFAIHGKQPPTLGQDPEPGDTFHISWELMKPSAGAHNVPYFRNPLYGPYENWTYANKSAFKVIWKSNRDGKFYARYYQAFERPKLLNQTKSGCLSSYATGTALYAFFTRATWPNRPTFVESWGLAKVVRVDVNHLQQSIDLSIVTGSLCTLTGPVHNLEVVRKQMADMKWEDGTPRLQNVDGKPNELDKSWIEDPNSYSKGKKPHGNTRKVHEGRTSCDYVEYLFQNRLAENAVRETAEGTNQCRSCHLRGIPCSYTATPLLFGLETDTVRHNRYGTFDNSVIRGTHAIFSAQATNTAATTAISIPDPGFRVTESDI